ncbi:peptidase A2 domain-containing protein [Trichonephila clavata]|uniref:Peptidase A2 domain-containing protein n=1 Tax=Trichonephila clavata TaxID=2740835 RepID=A0A8X6F0F7_TRICU|nr:peptidase A2 domain-containing protein [Trichonephila clavata]
MAEVTAVKIPPYNFSDPQLWFSTCERTFALGVSKAITDTGTKFNYIVSNLPPEAAAILRDLIIIPDETDPYGAIKVQLIQRTSESSQQEIRKLLTGEELGDRKPSELLRTLNRRASSHNVPKELMLELFLLQLPTSVQTILASITPITVEKAAEVADRILEVSTPNVSLSTNAIASSSENRILQEIERLNRRVDDLTMRQRTPERRNNSSSRNPSQNRSFSRSRESRFCWYLRKFQERAKRCNSPCSYKKKRTHRGVIATTFSEPHIPRRLFIKDRSSNIAFCIDTGSDVSVLPASISEKRKGNGIQQLSAANTSPSNVYDNATKLSAICKLVSPEVHSIKLVSGESIFHDVLREFPEIVQPPSFSQEAVSIDRVKSAYVWDDTDDVPLTGISKQQAGETDQHPKDKTMSHINKTESESNEKTIKKTRSGRHVRFPKDLEQYIT